MQKTAYDSNQSNSIISPFWLQELIICALRLGISKKELFEQFYIDEISEILRLNSQWNKAVDEIETTDAATFFS